MVTRKWKNGVSGSALSVIINSEKRISRIASILPDGTLSIDLAASKDKITADAELIHLFCKLFGLKPDQVEIVAGKGRAEKLVSLLGINPYEVTRIINHIIE